MNIQQITHSGCAAALSGLGLMSILFEKANSLLRLGGILTSRRVQPLHHAPGVRYGNRHLDGDEEGSVTRHGRVAGAEDVVPGDQAGRAVVGLDRLGSRASGEVVVLHCDIVDATQ